MIRCQAPIKCELKNVKNLIVGEALNVYTAREMGVVKLAVGGLQIEWQCALNHHEDLIGKDQLQ